MIDGLLGDMAKINHFDRVRLGRLLIKKRAHRLFDTGIPGTIQFKAVKRAD